MSPHGINPELTGLQGTLDLTELPELERFALLTLCLPDVWGLQVSVIPIFCDLVPQDSGSELGGKFWLTGCRWAAFKKIVSVLSLWSEELALPYLGRGAGQVSSSISIWIFILLVISEIFLIIKKKQKLKVCILSISLNYSLKPASFDSMALVFSATSKFLQLLLQRLPHAF